MIATLYHSIRKQYYRISGWAGAEALRKSAGNMPQNGRSGVLAFHGVDDANCTRYNTRFISKRKLEELIVLLRAEYSIVSLEEYCMRGETEKRPFVALTFDDGYQNNLTHVLPVLEKYEIPATFFVTGIHQYSYDILWGDLIDLVRGFLPHRIEIYGMVFTRNYKGYFINNSGIELKTMTRSSGTDFIRSLYSVLLPFAGFRKTPASEIYWKLLDPGQIRSLSSHPLISIGSHGGLHMSYTAVNDAEALSDMVSSKLELEKITGKEIRSMAFPCGDFSAETIALAANAGYTIQLTGTPGLTPPVNGLHVLPRMGINPYLSAKNLLVHIKTGRY